MTPELENDAAKNAAPLFEVKGGYFSYDKTGDVLRGINFAVKAPEILCVLGANGAGKTTLVKCMLGLRAWRYGASYLNGVDIRKIPAKEFWQKVGYVPQAKLSSFVYTVRETVLLGRTACLGETRTPGRRDEEAAKRAMALAGVERISDKLCSRISGGEYQLVLIARALSTEPSLLVFDEPESNLDFKNQKKVLSVITSLCRERGVAAAINTHYPEHAIEISNNALLLMPDKSALFGSSESALTEENLKRAFCAPVCIHRFEAGGKTRVSVVPLEE